MSWLPTVIFALCIGLVLEKAWHWNGRKLVERALAKLLTGFYDGETE